MRKCSAIVFVCLVLLLEGARARAGAEAEAVATAEAAPEADPEAGRKHFVVITEDVIPDVENTTHKVIRVNPLDLPAFKDDSNVISMDSSLYKIQSIPLPFGSDRKYISSQRMRKPQPPAPASSEAPQTIVASPIIRASLISGQKPLKPKQQKKKHLHFLYHQQNLAGDVVGKTMRVHVAPGAYPVYYVLAKTNGRFGKYPIKGFRNSAEFIKYLAKAKVEAPR